MRAAALMSCALLFTTGCFDAEPVEESTPVEQPEQPEDPVYADPPPVEATTALTCLADHPGQIRAIQRVRQNAEASVHELVTCGGAQIQISTNFVARVLLSNDQFFERETIETLDEFLGFSNLPFEHREDGRWRMALNATSSFDIAFMLPGSDAIETANVFDLAAYLEGAEVETSLTFEEMLDDWEAPNTYVITWTGYGPLADLMFPDGRPDEQRFVVEASLLDLGLLALGYDEDLPDFGPFENLPRLEIESAVDLNDTRDGVRISYSFGGQRQSLGHFHQHNQVAFDLQALVAEGEGVVLQGEAAALSVLGQGTLAGVLVYAVDDVAVDGVRVVDDFGDGAAYPRESYWCPEDWPEAPYADAMPPAVSE